jgi:1,6-anhydro-N-acetylmuramate kinase
MNNNKDTDKLEGNNWYICDAGVNYRTSAEGTTSKDVDYHDRLEQEVTQLRQENANWLQMNRELDYHLKRSHAEIAGLRLDNEQLRQAIAVLNDEPTNSL